MLCRIFPLYIYIRYRKRTRQGGTTIAPDSSIIRRMAGDVLGVGFYLCLFLSATVQAALCPAGWLTTTDAIGGVFATETTAAEDRVRCINTDVSNRQVRDVIGYSGQCTSSNSQLSPLCSARKTRCSNIGGKVVTDNQPWVCNLCNSGWWLNGAAQCDICGQNRYRVFGTVNACQNCPVGTVSTPGGRNITDCWVTSCGAGLYLWSSETGSAPMCKECAAGKFSAALGASSEETCAWCDAGKYQLYTGANSESACAGCPVGKFKATVGP